MYLDIDRLERELGEAGFAALRDEILRRAPIEAAHPAVTALDPAKLRIERQIASFNRNHPAPTDGAVADAIRRRNAAADLEAERRAQVAKLGQFHAEAYMTGTGEKRWRVHDRLHGRLAFIPQHPPARPLVLDGVASRAEALSRIEWLNRYYRSLGLNVGPHGLPACIVASDVTPLAQATIPDDLWLTLAPLMPGDPPGKRTTKARVTDERVILAGVVLYLRSDAGWHRLPRELGCAPMLCFRRLGEWQASGEWGAIEAELRTGLEDGAALPWHKLAGDPLVSPEDRQAMVERLLPPMQN